jgi:O-antigen/teichoic acid export membrane protein
MQIDAQSSQSIHDISDTAIRERTLRGGTITLGNQAAKFVLQTISTVILARLLTPSDFGLVAMVASLLGFVNLMRDFGLSSATVQKRSISQGELSTLFWVNVFAGFVMMLVMAALAPVVVRFYHRPELLWVTRAYAGIAMISSLSTQHYALMQRQMKFGALAVRDILAMVIGMAAGIGSAMAGLGYWALVAQQGASTAAGTIFLWRRSGWWPGATLSLRKIRQSLSFGGFMTVSSFVGYFNNNLDIILLGRKFGDVTVGLYSRAQGLLNKPLDQVLTPIMSVASPALSRLAADPRRFKRASFQLIRMACFGGCLLLMNTVPTADWIVRIFLGDRWISVATMFRILAVFGLLEPLAYLLGTILVAAGKPAAMAAWRSISTVVVVLSFFAGLPWGAVGVAAGYALSGIVTRTWLAFFVGRRVGISGWEFLRACSPFVIFAAAISAGFFLLRAVWQPGSAVVGILISAPLCTGTYIGGMLCFASGRRFLRESVRAVVDIFYVFRVFPTTQTRKTM